MSMRSILVIKGASNYGSVTEFADALIREWEKDHAVEVLDGSDFDAYHRKKEEILQGKKYDIVFSFNALALEEERDLIDYLLAGEAVYCTQLLDHPLHHHTRLLGNYPRWAVLAPDACHLSYLKQHYPNIPYVGFLPHGGSACEELIPYEDRKIDISFFGTYTSSQSVRDRLPEKNEVVRVLQEELMSQLQCHPQWTIEQAFSYMIEEYQLEESQEEIANDLAALRDADIFIRSYYREQVLQAILGAGIPVDVYGDCWEDFSCLGRDLLRVHPPCDYREAIEVTANSKISLNVMPWFKAGSHERVFNALACGAIALTDRSEYFEKLENRDGIVLYDLDQLEKLPEMIRGILADSRSGEFALAGYENGRINHLWANRAREILGYIDSLTGRAVDAAANTGLQAEDDGKITSHDDGKVMCHGKGEKGMRSIAAIVIAGGNLEQLGGSIESIREYNDRMEIQTLCHQRDPHIVEWCRQHEISVTCYGGTGDTISVALKKALEDMSACDVLLMDSGIRCLPFCLERMQEVFYGREKTGAVVPRLVTEEVIAGRKYFKDLTDYAIKQKRGDVKRIVDVGCRAVLLQGEMLQCVELDGEYLHPVNVLLDAVIQGTRRGYCFYQVGNALAEECAENPFHCEVDPTDQADYHHMDEKWHMGYVLIKPNQYLLPLLKGGKKPLKILEVGCACGTNLMEIGNLYPEAELYGIEINPRAVEMATAYADVRVGNIEEKNVDFGDIRFDYIIFGDVLEHLHDPKGTLEYCRTLLSEGGRVAASVPNLMHWSVMRGLIDGFFHYEDYGLLDRTHIHFFTYYEMVAMFDQAGYEILEVDYRENGEFSGGVKSFVDQLMSISQGGQEFMFRAFQYQILAEVK